MDDYEARIRELLLRARDLAQESEGLKVELSRLVADAVREAQSVEGQGGASVSRNPESLQTSFGVYSVPV